MRLLKPKFFLTAILAATLISFPFLQQQLEGRGGGGFSGGSFRAGGGESFHGGDPAVAASIEVVDMSPVHGAVESLKVPAVVLLPKAPVAAML